MAPPEHQPPTDATPRRHRDEPTRRAVRPSLPIVFVTANAFLRERLRAVFHDDDRVAVVDEVGDAVGQPIELPVDALVLDVSGRNEPCGEVSQELTAAEPAAVIALKGTAADDRRTTRTASSHHADGSDGVHHGEPVRLLTPREAQIVSAVVAGGRNKDIAAQFAITETTVKHHLSNIFDKVGASSRLELAMFARHHGLDQIDSDFRARRARPIRRPSNFSFISR